MWKAQIQAIQQVALKFLFGNSQNNKAIIFTLRIAAALYVLPHLCLLELETRRVAPHRIGLYWSISAPSAWHRQWIFSAQAISPRLHCLVTNDKAIIHIGQCLSR